MITTTVTVDTLRDPIQWAPIKPEPFRPKVLRVPRLCRHHHRHRQHQHRHPRRDNDLCLICQGRHNTKYQGTHTTPFLSAPRCYVCHLFVSFTIIIIIAIVIIIVICITIVTTIRMLSSSSIVIIIIIIIAVASSYGFRKTQAPHTAGAPTGTWESTSSAHTHTQHAHVHPYVYVHMRVREHQRTMFRCT